MLSFSFIVPFLSAFLSPGYTSGDKVFIKTEGKDITLPNLIGWSKKEVQTYASLAGIQLTIDGTSGHVTAQSVGENTVVHSGDSLTVAIS